MSFKEDFFEALRSVKRDFFRESEYTANGTAKADASEPDEKKTSDIRTESLKTENGEFRKPENIITPDDGYDDAYVETTPPLLPDEVVYEAFKQASTIDEAIQDDDEAEATDLTDEVPAFRSFIPPQAFDQANGNGNGRKIYDFSPDDMYSDDKTIISKNTIIRGALHTDDSLRLLGQIMGDIECKSNIVVAGKIRGNTSAANAYIVDAQIDGNMLCDDAININKDAWMLGNIRAQQAEIDGKVKGNIEIRHAISIGPASSVIGNISTDELEIKRGAFVNGQIIMYSPSRDVIDRFEDFDRG